MSKYKFNEQQDEMIITGLAMTPNQPIYRYDSEKDEEYYVYFTKSSIKKLMTKFMMEKKTDSVDLEHNGITVPAFVVESWIVEDPERDKTSVLGFNDVPKGSWAVSMKIRDEKLWDIIKNDPENLRGFSVAGNFQQKTERYSKERIAEDQLGLILEILEQVK